MNVDMIVSIIALSLSLYSVWIQRHKAIRILKRMMNRTKS